MKKFLMLLAAFLMSFWAVANAEWDSWSGTKLSDLITKQGIENPYDCADCDLDKGAKDARQWIKGINKDRDFSEYAQDIVSYILKFTYIIAVIYVIYAGFLILMAGWSDEKMWAAKNNIVYVMVWIITIYLANSIVLWTVNLVS